MRDRKGFSLLELLIALAIMSILVAIAMPSYTRYVERSKATEAVNELAAQSVAMEQGFQDNGNYTCQTATWSTTFFGYTCAILSGGQDFLITARGTGTMNAYAYSIDASGNRRTLAHPIATSTTCWLISGTEGC